MSWVYDRQVAIFSRVGAMLKAKFANQYKDSKGKTTFNVTRNNASNTNATFPTVYMNFIGATERGQTLEGTDINAVNMTVEVHVLTTSTQFVDNEKIAWGVTDAFKTLGFTVTMPSQPIGNANGVYESVSRYSRVIGMDDVLYTV
jgi:hypothetical protein